MTTAEDLNEVSPSSSWIFVEDCDNVEETNEQNVYYLNCSNEESYDKLQESDSDSVSIITESDEDLEPDTVEEVPEDILTEYLWNKLLTCGCIFLAIFTPIVINCALNDTPDVTFDEHVHVEVEKFLGFDAFDTEAQVDEDKRSKEVLQFIADDDLYIPNFIDKKNIPNKDYQLPFSKNDHEIYKRRVKSEMKKRNKIKDMKKKGFQIKKDNDKRDFEVKTQKKGDKSKRELKKPYKKEKYEKTKGEFPMKYKDKTRKPEHRKPEKSCTGEILKLKTLLDKQETKIRQLSRLLSNKNRDIELLERRILQELNDLKRIQKTYEENKLNATLSGEWYDNYFDERRKLRKREQASTWLFDRADFRNRKRNRNWYVDWMSDREAERAKRDDWRFTY